MRMNPALTIVTLFAATALVAGEAPAPETPSLDKQDIRAQLSPLRYTSLSAEISAKIDRITVREGEAFKVGQRLISLDCALQAAQSQRAHAALAAADKLVIANHRLAELNSVGQLELDIAEAELAKARADVALTDATLTKCEIVAPFAGRVAEQKMREKQFVPAGQPILEIIDDSSLELEFIVPSRWLAWLKPGHTGFTCASMKRARPIRRRSPGWGKGRPGEPVHQDCSRHRRPVSAADRGHERPRPIAPLLPRGGVSDR